MDEVRIGMYITVLKGKMEQKVFPGHTGPIVVNQEKCHYNGKVLEVLCVDFPYVVINIHEGFGSRRDQLDLRKIDVMQLDPDYVNKLVPKLKIQEDSFWKGIKNSSLEEADTIIEEIFKDL